MAIIRQEWFRSKFSLSVHCPATLRLQAKKTESET